MPGPPAATALGADSTNPCGRIICRDERSRSADPRRTLRYGPSPAWDADCPFGETGLRPALTAAARASGNLAGTGKENGPPGRRPVCRCHRFRPVIPGSGRLGSRLPKVPWQTGFENLATGRSSENGWPGSFPSFGALPGVTPPHPGKFAEPTSENFLIQPVDGEGSWPPILRKLDSLRDSCVTGRARTLAWSHPMPQHRTCQSDVPRLLFNLLFFNDLQTLSRARS